MEWFLDFGWFLDFFGNDAHQKIGTSVVIFFSTTVVSIMLGRWWGRWRANREWAKKHFMNRLIVSLNNFSDGYLKIRTVFERSLEEVFINPLAVEKVLAAAHKTTEKNPMLPIEPADRWFILNFVLNAVAEEYNEGLVQFDGFSAKYRSGSVNNMAPVKYLLWLTCEQVGPDRIRKVRAMMIRKDILLAEVGGLPETCLLEQEWHADRMDTLRQARDVYLAGGKDNFLTLEVYI